MSTKIKGVNIVLHNTRQEILSIRRSATRGLFALGFELYNDSAEQTPVVTGNLRGSEYIEGKAGRNPKIEVGYTASYAPFIHENPRAGKTEGVSPKGRKYTAGKTTSGKKSNRIVFSVVGNWKFLENPLKAIESRFKKYIDNYIRMRKVMGKTPPGSFTKRRSNK